MAKFDKSRLETIAQLTIIVQPFILSVTIHQVLGRGHAGDSSGWLCVDFVVWLRHIVPERAGGLYVGP